MTSPSDVLAATPPLVDRLEMQEGWILVHPCTLEEAPEDGATEDHWFVVMAVDAGSAFGVGDVVAIPCAAQVDGPAAFREDAIAARLVGAEEHKAARDEKLAELEARCETLRASALQAQEDLRELDAKLQDQAHRMDTWKRLAMTLVDLPLDASIYGDVRKQLMDELRK